MVALFDRRVYVSEACRLSNHMAKKNLALICCYEQNETYKVALAMFMTMNYHTVIMNEVVVFKVEDLTIAEIG